MDIEQPHFVQAVALMILFQHCTNKTRQYKISDYATNILCSVRIYVPQNNSTVYMYLWTEGHREPDEIYRKSCGDIMKVGIIMLLRSMVSLKAPSREELRVQSKSLHKRQVCFQHVLLLHTTHPYAVASLRSAVLCQM